MVKLRLDLTQSEYMALLDVVSTAIRQVAARKSGREDATAVMMELYVDVAHQHETPIEDLRPILLNAQHVESVDAR